MKMYATLLNAALISASISIVIAQRSSEWLHAEDRAESLPLSILLVTIPYPGDVIPVLTLGEELVRRGHNVTLVTAPSDFIQREVERYHINLWSIGEGFSSVRDPSILQSVAGENRANTQLMKSFEIVMDFQRRVLKTIDNPAVTSFDIIVGDTLSFPCLMCLSRKWNIAGVYLSLSLPYILLDFHTWPFPAVQSGYTDNLTFIQRLVSTVNTKLTLCILKIYIFITSLFRRDFCKTVKISRGQLLHSADYHPQIITSSFGFGFPRVVTPLTDYVGPMISQSQPELPQDIAEWLHSRDCKSVVYMSMGSTGILTSEQAEMIINGATQANLSVVWSLRKSNQHILQHMTYDPDNVLIAEWVPQMTVLKDPRINSAILHGGMGGVQEALSCGVPILVIPFFFDQIDNAVRVQHYHYGEMVYLYELTAPVITQKLRLLGSQVYRKNVKMLQRIYKKDGGVSKAADLVEFYANVGYEHLVPSYAKYNWSWVEFYNMDVCFVLILAVVLPGYLLYRLVHRCLSSACSPPRIQKEKVKKSQ